MPNIGQTVAVIAIGGIAGCMPQAIPGLSDLAQQSLPSMAWDGQEGSDEWTVSTLVVIAAEDEALASRVPQDVTAFCPGYENANLPARRAFWSGLLSAIARYESTWNPEALGAGGQYVGLMQISPTTAKAYDCSATSVDALQDGAANLSCAVKIVAAQVGRDEAVAGEGNRGVARDWGPMKKRDVRSQIAAWTAAQSYCL